MNYYKQDHSMLPTELGISALDDSMQKLKEVHGIVPIHKEILGNMIHSMEGLIQLIKDNGLYMSINNRIQSGVKTLARNYYYSINITKKQTHDHKEIQDSLVALAEEFLELHSLVLKQIEKQA